MRWCSRSDRPGSTVGSTNAVRSGSGAGVIGSVRPSPESPSRWWCAPVWSRSSTPECSSPPTPSGAEPRRDLLPSGAAGRTFPTANRRHERHPPGRRGWHGLLLRDRLSGRAQLGPPGLLLGTYSALPYAAPCRVALRVRPVRCRFAVGSSDEVAMHRAARGTPYAGALFKVFRTTLPASGPFVSVFEI